MEERPARPEPLILVVDDDPSILAVLEARLTSAGFRVLTAARAERALELMDAHPVELVVSDVRMPGMGGAGLLAEVRAGRPGLPVILLTAYGTIPDAVANIQGGAADYLTKPFDGRQLVAKVRALLERTPAAPAADPIPASPSAPAPAPDADAPLDDRLWGGRSPAMREFCAQARRVAKSDVGVLLLGESGTGKELAARAIHALSPRAKGPLVVVDCGSTPATLLESELFGHVKGSFTHALKDKKGLMAEADGGALFLDEIGNISHEMQTRLLRFLQERTIRRIGDTREVPVNCRVIAATNADLPDLVRRGEFREDLYFRLKVVTLRLPPLRERREDIEPLARRILDDLCRAQGRPPLALSERALAVLRAHAWPGNVRELRNALEAGTVFCTGGTIRPEDLQLEDGPGEIRPEIRSEVRSEVRGEVPAPGGAAAPDSLSLEDNEHQAILRALKHTGWNKTAAADELGISRRAIHYKIKKYGIGDPGPGEGR